MCAVHIEAAAEWLVIRKPAAGVSLIRILVIRSEPWTFSRGYMCPVRLTYVRVGRQGEIIKERQREVNER